MKYQPVDIKTVLAKLSDALIAGRSDILMSSRVSGGCGIAVNVMRLAMLVAIAGIFGGGWYLAKRGFGREWRYRVVEELHRRGVEASVGRLTLDPFRGLVAQNVRIFDYKNRENTLAVISEISLDI